MNESDLQRLEIRAQTPAPCDNCENWIHCQHTGEACWPFVRWVTGAELAAKPMERTPDRWATAEVS